MSQNGKLANKSNDETTSLIIQGPVRDGNTFLLNFITLRFNLYTLELSINRL